MMRGFAAPPKMRRANESLSALTHFSREIAGRNVCVPDLFLPIFNARFLTSRVRSVRTVFSAQLVDGLRALVTSDAVCGEASQSTSMTAHSDSEIFGSFMGNILHM